MSRISPQPSLRQNRAVASGFAENREQRVQRAAVQPGGYLWPELRVGREAVFEDAYDWDYFQNQLGFKNKRRGSAKPVGEIACHYLTDKEMRCMIIDKYDKIDRGRGEAMKIYRKVEKAIAGFILDMQLESSFRMNPGELCERPELMGKAIKAGKSLVGRAMFQSTGLKIRPPEEGGLMGLDAHRIGFDLSDNSFLGDERNEVVNFLRREEGLDTKRFVRRDWVPHAVIFRLSEHLRTDDIAMRWPSETPPSMDFGPVRTINGDGLSGK